MNRNSTHQGKRIIADLRSIKPKVAVAALAIYCLSSPTVFAQNNPAITAPENNIPGSLTAKVVPANKNTTGAAASANINISNSEPK